MPALVRQSAWRRLVIHLNRRLVRSGIFIPDNVLPMPPAELVKTMRRLQRAAPRRATEEVPTDEPRRTVMEADGN